MPNGQRLSPEPEHQLLLTTLGGASLACVSASVHRSELLGPGKPLGLLVYLAFSPGRTASRDHLVDLLWADLEPDAARHALRQTVWFLRHRLGESVFVARDGDLTLCASLESDRDAFLDAVNRLDFERAVELYRGDFLPGFAAPGGADFEHWADLERYRLRLLFARAAERVVRDWLGRGRLRKAKELAARARDTDPHDETAWRLLLEALLAANDRVGAELEATALERLLVDAGRPPEPATRTLLALVHQAPPPGEATAPKPTLIAELIGREREFSTIIAAWDGARRGAGRHIHVTGGPGLGKTRLLSDVHARLRAMGSRAVPVRANPGERQTPYALASDLAAALARLPGAAGVSPAAAAALVALNPSLSSQYAVSPDRAADLEALRHRETALGELLGAVADEQPVALLTDDVHCADGASRKMLEALLARLSDHHVLAVTTTRPGPEANVATSATTHLSLDPLSETQTGALLASLGTLPSAPWAEWLPAQLHAATHGSPLLILESLHLALERAWLTLDEGRWECPDPTALGAELARGGALRRRIEELPRHEHWLLLLLSVAGTPLRPGLLARAADREETAVLADLAALEVRGLATRDGDEWMPGHDEIGARALEIATSDALRAAHQTVGRTLAETAGTDSALLQRAGQHLAAGEAESLLQDVFARWILAARRQGDRRSLGVLAGDLLAGSADRQRIGRLLSSLPLRMRLGFTSRTRIATAAGLAGAAAVAGAALLLRPPPPAPDAVLIALRNFGSDSASAYAVPIRRNGWEDIRVIEPREAGQPYQVLAGAVSAARVGALAPSPDGRQWVFARTVSDSGGTELFLATEDGLERRLTYSPKDDKGAAWSPDGRSIVFSTDRWNANSWSDLAVLDLATGRVRQLTSGDAVDSRAQWSPDGTRIAFHRQFVATKFRSPADISEYQLCWITADGHRQRCFASRSGVRDPVGWYDPRQVLAVVTDSSANASLARVDLDNGDMQIVNAGVAGGLSVSSDGRWVACLCERAGLPAPGWFVYPTDRPDLAVPVAPGSKPATLSLSWRGATGRQRYLERLEILAPGPIPLDVTHRLRARGFDLAGRPMAVPVLSWRSADTTVATIDSIGGEIHPRKVGSAMVYASAGGRREDSTRLVITPPDFRTVLVEDWEKGLDVGWIPFGDPLPAVTTAPGGRTAFWNRGDDYFYSGAYSRSEFRSASGLGLDAEVFSSITAMRAQSWDVELRPWTDPASVAKWDHRTGGLPAATETMCNFFHPASDGVANRNRVLIYAHVLSVDPAVTTGRPYTVRLQIFPDGSCGFALNGKPLLRTASTFPLDSPYRVVLQGKSVETKMLVGHVEVWEGVRGGVDWNSLERKP